MATLSPPRARRRTQDEVGPFAHLDVLVLVLPIVISALGLLMIYDSSRRRLAAQGLSSFYYVERQGIAIVLGLIGMGIVMAVDYRRIRDAWPLVYLAVLPLLAGVLVIGRNHNGAQAWFQVGPLQFQPSELAKIAVIVAVAGYCHRHSRRPRRVAAHGRGNSVYVYVYLRPVRTLLLLKEDEYNKVKDELVAFALPAEVQGASPRLQETTKARVISSGPGHEPDEIKVPAKAPVQPISFSHSQHVQVGLECNACHPAEGTGELVHMPEAVECLNCHQTIQKDRPSIQKLVAFQKKNKSVPWVRIYNFRILSSSATRSMQTPRWSAKRVTALSVPGIFCGRRKIFP